MRWQHMIVIDAHLTGSEKRPERAAASWPDLLYLLALFISCTCTSIHMTHRMQELLDIGTIEDDQSIDVAQESSDTDEEVVIQENVIIFSNWS